MLFPVFALYVPRWRCTLLEEFGKNCTAYEACSGNVEFEPIEFRSAALEFDWICGSSAYMRVAFSQVQFIGVFVSTLVFAIATDRYGRRPMALISICGGGISLALAGIAPNWQLLLVARAAVGVWIGATNVAMKTFLPELVAPEQRMPLFTLLNWGISRLTLAGICAIFGEWRRASLAFALIAIVPLLIVLFVIPEARLSRAIIANWPAMFAVADLVAQQRPPR